MLIWAGLALALAILMCTLHWRQITSVEFAGASHDGDGNKKMLSFAPGIFTVERHSRGKSACALCEMPEQAPVPAHVIVKGIVAP